jgi:hypothetical protein
MFDKITWLVRWASAAAVSVLLVIWMTAVVFDLAGAARACRIAQRRSRRYPAGNCRIAGLLVVVASVPAIHSIIHRRNPQK